MSKPLYKKINTLIVVCAVCTSLLLSLSINSFATEDKTVIIVKPEGATNKSVTVTIVYPKDATKKQYKIDSDDWLEYTEAITIDYNCEVFANSDDDRDPEASWRIKNIDKDPPDEPTFETDEQSSTEGTVTVKIIYPADAATKEYKLGNNNWSPYKEPVKLSNDNTVYARCTDEAGNTSKESEKNISVVTTASPEAEDTTAKPPKTVSKYFTIKTTVQQALSESKSEEKLFKLEDSKPKVYYFYISKNVSNDTIQFELREDNKKIVLAQLFKNSSDNQKKQISIVVVDIDKSLPWLQIYLEDVLVAQIHSPVVFSGMIISGEYEEYATYSEQEKASSQKSGNETSDTKDTVKNIVIIILAVILLLVVTFMVWTFIINRKGNKGKSKTGSEETKNKKNRRNRKTAESVETPPLAIPDEERVQTVIQEVYTMQEGLSSIPPHNGSLPLPVPVTPEPVVFVEPKPIPETEEDKRSKLWVELLACYQGEKRLADTNIAYINVGVSNYQDAFYSKDAVPEFKTGSRPAENQYIVVDGKCLYINSNLYYGEYFVLSEGLSLLDRCFILMDSYQNELSLNTAMNRKIVDIQPAMVSSSFEGFKLIAKGKIFVG